MTSERKRACCTPYEMPMSAWPNAMLSMVPPRCRSPLHASPTPFNLCRVSRTRSADPRAGILVEESSSVVWWGAKCQAKHGARESGALQLPSPNWKRRAFGFPVEGRDPGHSSPCCHELCPARMEVYKSGWHFRGLCETLSFNVDFVSFLSISSSRQTAQFLASQLLARNVVFETFVWCFLAKIRSMRCRGPPPGTCASRQKYPILPKIAKKRDAIDLCCRVLRGQSSAQRGS